MNAEKLRTQENEKDYLECKAESHWDWNIAKSNIAQYCFLKEIFSEEKIKSFKNKGNGPVVSQYDLFEVISIAEINENFCIFWRIDTVKAGTYLRLNFYKKYDENNENLENIIRNTYNNINRKIYNVIEKYKNELSNIYKIENCNYKKQNEIPILHINLKEYIKAGKDEMDKLVIEVKKLHSYLQTENFE